MDKCDFNERSIIPIKAHYIQIPFFYKNISKSYIHNLLCMNDSQDISIRTQSSLCCYQAIRHFKLKLFLLIN